MKHGERTWIQVTSKRLPDTVLFLALAGVLWAAAPVEPLKFLEPGASDSDRSGTVQSIVKVQGTGGLNQDALYLMTHYGDREELFRQENQDLIENPLKDQTWRYCSLFSAVSEGGAVMGRNWDNQNVGSIIVSLYHPPKGYSSISFSRAIDMGYPLNLDLKEIAPGELGNRLLLAPFYSMDGINEQGLAVAVAGLNPTQVEQRKGKDPVFITYLVRKILDRAKNVEEAVNLAEMCVPFGLDRGTMNGHFLVADSSGRSVVLEYVKDSWVAIEGEKSWQVLTNKPIHGASDAELRERCRRYRGISEALEGREGDLNWEDGLHILRDSAQKGTTWSVVYSPTAKDLHFTVYQDWDTIYHLKEF